MVHQHPTITGQGPRIIEHKALNGLRDDYSRASCHNAHMRV